jgi:hypothetical protein
MLGTMITISRRPLRAWIAAAGVLLLAACASYDGSSLVPGTSTEADVQKLMGKPDAKVKLDAGAVEWFYTRPAARQTYAITFGPDGRFRSSEQRLDRAFIDRIRRDWTAKAVSTLLGPPYETVRFERQERDVWTYHWQEYSVRRLLHVQFSYDGLVREVLDMIDEAYQPKGARMGPGVFRGGLGATVHLDGRQSAPRVP